MKRLVLISAVVVALALGSCRDVATANGTALFVTVDWRSDVGAIHALTFSGALSNEQPAFRTTTLPTPSAGALTQPQSVRVLLDDTAAGHEVTVRVDALDAQGTTVVSGQSTAMAELGREVKLSVTLGTLAGQGGGAAGGGMGGGDAGGDGGGDAGGSAGGQGGGSADDGGLDAGSCDCATGCCLGADPRCLNTLLPVKLFVCGPPRTACSFEDGGAQVCDRIRSDSCINGGCSCGNLGMPCGYGQSCEMGQCVCGAKGGCEGCCAGNFCVPTNGLARDAGVVASQTQANCGAGGTACRSCGVGCADDGNCTVTPAVCLNPSECATAGVCVGEDFPRCRSGGTCTACDPFRSSACAPGNAVCRCGTGAACAANEVCSRGPADDPSVVPRCQRLE